MNFNTLYTAGDTEMSNGYSTNKTRRGFIVGGAAMLAAPAIAQTTTADVNRQATTEVESALNETVRRNISSFRTLDWQPYFNNTKNGAILVDIDSRAVHYWSEDQSMYKLYPSSVPLTQDLTRRGRTQITLKDPKPSWRPTPSMLERNPDWPEFIGPGPDNPLGTRSLHLSWTYYRIHGTHDTRKIGRKSSNGCIGLYNEHIEELYELANVGTQVLLI
jgi:L,D-transpeptidase ErfK/SrfK